MADIQRRKTPTVKIGQVRVGWAVPVVVQSMTNTDTADVNGTIEQVAALAMAGSELVRVTVNNDEAAAAVPYIVEGLDKRGITVPIVGDFHYNGHLLLKKCNKFFLFFIQRINEGFFCAWHFFIHKELHLLFRAFWQHLSNLLYQTVLH